jgi:hypothetical protein
MRGRAQRSVVYFIVSASLFWVDYVEDVFCEREIIC